MSRKEYEGRDITVTFDMRRCIHARNCFLKLPDVFDPSKRPWVQPDNASAEQIAKLDGAFLCRCGASGNKPFCDGSHKDAGFKGPA